MIDTIVLRIHNLHKNQHLVDILSNSKTCDKYFDHEDPFKEYVNEETGEILESQSDFLKIKSIEYGDSKKKILLIRNKKLTSSHYYLAYQIRMDRDFIEFNFSIPKLMYGTNMIQFVPHATEFKAFHTRGDLEDIRYVQSKMYRRLMIFIKRFMNKTFNFLNDSAKVDPNDIEINRLDICFNQYFDSKELALRYLDYQKRIKKRYLRETSKNKTDWGTSIFLNTKRYAAKIYHKGSEYSSSNGERNHHQKINKNHKKPIFQIDDVIDKNGKLITEGLQSYGDKILRYEISFKNAMMSHLFRKFIFAKNCTVKKRLEKSFKRVDKIQKRCDRLRQKNTDKPYKELMAIPKEVRTEHKLYKNLINKTASFRLGVNK